MSTSPKTKSYWHRVERIAKRLRFKVGGLYEPIDLYAFGREIDSGATTRMIEEALKLAIQDQHKHVAWNEKWLAESKEELAQLEALTSQVRRSRLKVVPPTMKRTT